MTNFDGLTEEQEMELVSRLDKISAEDYTFPTTFTKIDWGVWLIVQICFAILFCLPILGA